jgi:exodeoxyribonuclease VII large subunit
LRGAAPAPAELSRELARLAKRLAAGAARAQRDRRARLESAGASLGHLDPTQVLARGYAIVRDARGAVVRTGAGLARGDALDLAFAEGGAKVTVDEPR